MRFLVSLCAFVGVATLARAEDRQIQIDVTVLSGPSAMKDHADWKAVAGKEYPICKAMPQADAARLLASLRAKAGAKLLAQPSLMTNSGQVAVFSICGHVLVQTASGSRTYPVGTSIGFRPVVRDDGNFYLEVCPTIQCINEPRGVETAFGFVPGFDEMSIRAAADVKPGETLLIVMGDEAKCQVVAATPHLVPVTPRANADARTVGVALKLMAKYRDACANGDMEQAREFATMALDLDPACFVPKPTPPAPPQKIVPVSKSQQ